MGEKGNFDSKRFFGALLFWFLIVHVNEVIQHFLSFRQGEKIDILHNTLARLFHTMYKKEKKRATPMARLNRVTI